MAGQTGGNTGAHRARTRQRAEIGRALLVGTSTEAVRDRSRDHRTDHHHE